MKYRLYYYPGLPEGWELKARSRHYLDSTVEAESEQDAEEQARELSEEAGYTLSLEPVQRRDA